MHIDHERKAKSSFILSWARRIGLVVSLASVALMGARQCDAQDRAKALVSFDIPSQSLSLALETYARISGREVLYDGALAIGLQSHSLKGAYMPEEALRNLLAGTGLSAHFKDANFFVLSPTSLADRQEEARRVMLQARYYGHLQGRLKSAFCSNREVFPGNYRLAARLWIGPSGEVQHEKRLASSGDEKRDADLDHALQQIELGSPPPDGVPQPITILIVPNSPGVRQACTNASAGRSLAGTGP